MTNVQSYKEMEIRASLMKTHPEWLKTIAELKNLQLEDNKKYVLTYRQLNQRKNRDFIFDNVTYDEDTFIFTFVYYSRVDGKRMDTIDDRLTIKDIEVISYKSMKSGGWTPDDITKYLG